MPARAEGAGSGQRDLALEATDRHAWSRRAWDAPLRIRALPRVSEPSLRSGGHLRPSATRQGRLSALACRALSDRCGRVRVADPDRLTRSIGGHVDSLPPL